MDIFWNALDLSVMNLEFPNNVLPQGAFEQYNKELFSSLTRGSKNQFDTGHQDFASDMSKLLGRALALPDKTLQRAAFDLGDAINKSFGSRARTDGFISSFQVAKSNMARRLNQAINVLVDKLTYPDKDISEAPKVGES